MYLTKRNALLGSLLVVAAFATAAIARSSHPDPVTVPERTAIYVPLDPALANNPSKPRDYF